MSEPIWEKCRFRIEVRRLWIEKHGRELLSRPDSQICSARRRVTITTG